MLSLNTNFTSLLAQKVLNLNNKSLGRSQEKLITGLRINRPGDDAAGYTIKTGMTTRISSLSQAVRNANDGISMVQISMGAVGQAIENLQRMRVLALNAANDTKGSQDVLNLQQEIKQRIGQLDTISQSTSFNGINMLDSTAPLETINQNQQAVLTGLASGWLEESERIIEEFYGIKGDGDTLKIDLKSVAEGGIDGAGGTAARVVANVPVGNGKSVAGSMSLEIDMNDFIPPNLPNGGSAPVYNDRIIMHEMVHAIFNRSVNVGTTGVPTWFNEGSAEFIHGADERIAGLGTGGTMAGNLTGFASANADYAKSFAAVRYMHDMIKAAGGNGVKDIFTKLQADPSTKNLDDALTEVAADLGGFNRYVSGAGFSGAAVTATAAGFETAFNASGADFINEQIDTTNADTGSIQGSDVNSQNPVKNAIDVVPDPFELKLTPLKYFNIDWLDGDPTKLDGFNAPITERTTLQVGDSVSDTFDMEFRGLSATSLGVDKLDITENQGLAMRDIDRAINTLTNFAAELGAIQNRLAKTIENDESQQRGQEAARGRIQDTDFTKEIAFSAKQQILQQVGTAMLAQANQLPQSILQLI
ncbi:flagellinolysin [Piscirickettsia litoralis]|uniref:Flagellin n=1 Tax=Piscirickettsia litoralis TaxID=1891921 RepID=A0ABX3A4F3_9GAMM|nr:flagellinolysin [Piscirickettsia litoralis]ODN43741.1 hypothetical protein BGC07_13595 [Piscirickettsia litoralis]